MTQKVHNVVIVGTGPAGLTAAIYTARASLSPVIYAGLLHGGQLTTTTEVENWPGSEHGIMGPKLMQDMTAQAERFGTEIVYDTITKVDFSGPIKKLWTDSEEIHAKAVIISTGATAKTMKLEDEARLMGRGLSTCATCDGFFYKNKKVLVIGGGDSAMEEATYLSKLCSEVILVHRRDVFKASPIMVDRAKANKKIEFKVPYHVTRLLSDDTGVIGAVLEVMEDAARREHERAPGRIDPVIAEKEAHRALDDEEHVVLLVRVRAGPLGVWLEPPLGDRVQARRLGAVGLEHGLDGTAWISAALAGTEVDRRTRRVRHLLTIPLTIVDVAKITPSLA
ncbi:MAG: hypothetical protein EOP09_14105, partial [Proteobacteria bacterium]